MPDAGAPSALQGRTPALSVGPLASGTMALPDRLALLEAAGVPLVHVDVMDGRFCPGRMGSPGDVAALGGRFLRDVHLMVEDPLDVLPAYAEAGADVLTVQAESTRHLHRTLQAIGELPNAADPARGIMRGVALNPGTPLTVLAPVLDEVDLVLVLGVNPGFPGQRLIASCLSRLADVAELVRGRERPPLVAFDGGVDAGAIAGLRARGADVVVSGSAIFGAADPAATLAAMLDDLLRPESMPGAAAAR